MKLARSRNLIHLIPIRLEAVDSEGFDVHRRVTVPGYRWSQQASITDTAMPKKSIYRQPGAQHFQLVHRSQRDPLIHDPEASQHVLKPFERENIRKVLRTTISLMQWQLAQFHLCEREGPEKTSKKPYLQKKCGVRRAEPILVRQPCTTSFTMIRITIICSI